MGALGTQERRQVHYDKRKYKSNNQRKRETLLNWSANGLMVAA